MNLPESPFAFHSLQDLQRVIDQIQRDMLASLEKVETTQDAELQKT
ncbi:MAG: hypothetical protein K0S07_1672, partial [Chlamydiales bacterium]|nr:hypothetical protein [Chlamydiales bacterium]